MSREERMKVEKDQLAVLGRLLFVVSLMFAILIGGASAAICILLMGGL